MKNRPMHDLGKEHGGIMTMLRVMEKIVGKLKDGEKVEAVHLSKITGFLINFADKCHHGKEEGYLFPELSKDREKTELIDKLLDEHKIGRNFIKNISQALASYKPGGTEMNYLAMNMEGYIQLLTKHIKKENPVFYEADKNLSKKVQNEMEEKFEELEKNVIGEGKHEEYHKLLDDLQQIYL